MQSNVIESITKKFGKWMILRLIRSIENQSNNNNQLNLIDLAANRMSITFDWLPLAAQWDVMCD